MAYASDNALIINHLLPDAQAVRPYHWKFCNTL